MKPKLFFIYMNFIAILFMNYSCTIDEIVNNKENEDIVIIKVISGNNQSGDFGVLLANPIIVQVLDINEIPLSNINVLFCVQKGNGKIQNNMQKDYSAKSNINGEINIYWILGYSQENIIAIDISEEGLTSTTMIVDALGISQINCNWLDSNIEFPYYDGSIVQHDGRILETPNFLIFSDNDNDKYKYEVGIIAEEALNEYKNKLDVNNTDLKIYDRETKVKIYTSKDKYLDNPIQYATTNTIFFYRRDSSFWGVWQLQDDTYNNIVEHELAHLTQFRLGALFYLCEDWFLEGFAEYMSGGVHRPITTTAEFEQWCSYPGHTMNPLDVKSLSDLPIPVSLAGEYYPAFHLVMKYLMESGDVDVSLIDVKDMFIEISSGVDFPEAFYNCFDSSINYFRDNYYELMKSFLEEQMLINNLI